MLLQLAILDDSRNSLQLLVQDLNFILYGVRRMPQMLVPAKVMSVSVMASSGSDGHAKNSGDEPPHLSVSS